MTKKRNWRIAGITAALLSGIGCFLLMSHGRTSAGAVVASAPDVEVATVEQKDIPVYREWIGTLDGLVNAAIRAQVTGYQGGVDTQLNALDADRDLLQAKLDLRQIKLNELLSIVQLYKALGGGWS
jgi:hypothetical protein